MSRPKRALVATKMDTLLRARKLSVSVEQLERELLQEPQPECAVEHSFGPGLYIRKVTLPAGLVVIGHRHTTAHLNVMLEGVLVMVQADGSYQELKAPQTYVGLPGRKVAFVKKKTVWLNVHATDETDIAKLEAMFLDKSPAFQEAWARRRQQRLEDNIDYFDVLKEFGIPESTVRAVSENPSDQIPFPYGTYKCQVGPSQIEGLGLFACSSIAQGEAIAPARVGGKRTPAGRYTNHARDPNAIMVLMPGGDVTLFALRDIHGNQGGFEGEEITCSYRETLKTVQGVSP